MSWIRRRRGDEPPPSNRLPDLEFLGLLRDALEEYAPGVTRGAELKGNSLLSPRGWAIATGASHDPIGHHYDVVALPDASIQPDVPCFIDCVVASTGDPRDAASNWVETAGACLLELLDRRERFAVHIGPDDERGVPGWHMIASGATAFGLDLAENRRLQIALLETNVLHRVADTFTADLESPYFNGVKVFYGGAPGAMQYEVRINGERHVAASAAMAALGLPEPTTFTSVRFYALLLPIPAGGGEPAYPSTRLSLDHVHGVTCGCGGELDPERPGFELTLPHLVAELSAADRARRVRVDTGAMMVVDGVGNFLKVRLPIRLNDGRTVNYLVWIYVKADVIEQYVERVHAKTLDGYRFEGLLCNGIEPWGDDLLKASVVLGGQRNNEDGSIHNSEVIETAHPLLRKVMKERWPAEFVLGDRDSRRNPR
jgi:hypothetical protein